MVYLRFAVFVVSIFVIPSLCYADSKAIKLFKKGYRKSQDSCCVSFDGCDYGKKYKVGLYTFECGEYSYGYSYGDVYILEKGYSTYLCTDDDVCYEGKLN